MQQRRRRRAFTPAVKAKVVKLCRKGDRSIPEVARDLGLTGTAVRRWVTQAEIDRGSRPALTSSEQAELAPLPRENRQLREVLGKPPSDSSNWSRLRQMALAADGRVVWAGFPATLLDLAYSSLAPHRLDPRPRRLRRPAPRRGACAAPISSVSWSARSASPPGSHAIASCWLP